MDAARPTIRTPDQRIRVFVSSTLRELEPERHAVRAAIERLHLAPVMFELGARPHPPRDLYRSYLAQSDIFLGLYWEKYGWVAPEEEISGLEDEYRLSAGLPSLIYMKEPAPDREPRLAELLDRIRGDDRTSYKSFTTPDELADLVTGDLATLLAERFDASASGAAGGAAPASPLASAASSPVPGIPAPYTPLVDRELPREQLAEMLDRPDTRLITIVGPGGVGKSRIAIDVALAAARAGREVAFALLETVQSPDRVDTAIARALGVRDTGLAPLEELIVSAVGDRPMLLVVDNMEHLLGAAPLLVRLITETPRMQLLVTSRSPLRIRAERVHDLGPLEVPTPGASPREAERSAAVELFVQRAVAAQPSFRLTPANVGAVAAICATLEGMPLAIELAAARVRTLAPHQIVDRLDHALTLLSAGARDLPERQRALGRTIGWSVDLLGDTARTGLAVLSVFAGTFTVTSAENVLRDCGVDDPLDVLEALVDASLLSGAGDGEHAAFRMQTLVRQYADALLTADQREAATIAWIGTYAQHAREADPVLRGPRQAEMLALLELEAENLAAIVRVLLDRRELDAAAEFSWTLYLFFWIRGYLGLQREWMMELLALAQREGIAVTDRTRGIALYHTNAVRFWNDLEFDAIPGLRQSREAFLAAGDAYSAALAGLSVAVALLARVDPASTTEALALMRTCLDEFRGIGNRWGEAMMLVVLGRVELLGHHPAEAEQHFEQSLRLATAEGEAIGLEIAEYHRGWARFFQGDIAGAEDGFAACLDLAVRRQHDEGTAYGLEGFVGLAAHRGDARTAGLLLGAARALRTRKGLFNPPAFDFHLLPVGALREAGHGDEFDRAVQEGLGLSVAEALEHVRA